MKHINRDKMLTPEEAEKYNLIRTEIEQELPELIDNHHKRMARMAEWERTGIDEELFDADNDEFCLCYLNFLGVKMFLNKDERFPGWEMSWQHGTMNFGGKSYTPEKANRVAALFVHLWRKRVDCGLLATSYHQVIE
jgi:hypothetical protein